MEAIKNYLDMMFANLPNTGSVLTAKEELLQMMEDKYTELIAEGKSENEAVGSVIAEFGNLSELAEALGVEEEVKQQEEKENAKGDVRVITADEAKGYILMRSRRAFTLALGIACFIVSVVCPIVGSSFLPDSMEAIYVCGLFAFIVAGIMLIIFGTYDRKKWKFVHKQKCALSMDATKAVKEEKNRVESICNMWMVIGVVFCSTCWFPAVLSSNMGGEWGDCLGGAALFIFVAIGVFFIINSSTRMSSFKDLLELNPKGSVKREYENAEAKEKSKVQYTSPVAEAVMGVYWPTVTCIYLITSFITFKWGFTWIIWPLAAILHAILQSAFVKEN